jgi:hypothetical protein
VRIYSSILVAQYDLPSLAHSQKPKPYSMHRHFNNPNCFSLISSTVLLTVFCFGLLSCQATEQDIVSKSPDSALVEVAQTAEASPSALRPAEEVKPLPQPTGNTIAQRFQPPPGFIRDSLASGSFGQYLRNFALYPGDRKVHLYNGSLKSRQDVHAAVLDIDVGQRDLQQCADAVMRLRGEYLYGQGRYQDIHFNFTNGFRADYERWRQGERIKVNGNQVNWVAGRPAGDQLKAWRQYLTMVFSYAGTLSLAQELNSVALKALEIGDVFIQGGSPGHAVIVVDKCTHPATGELAFLLAQSYMPAQEIHVLVNPLAPDRSPWYFVSQIQDRVNTPEWSFRSDHLARFPELD